MFVETVKTALHLEACILPEWKRLTKGKNGVISPKTLDCYYNTRVRLTMGTLGTSHWTVISHCL